ncbi:purine-nucleoside phosphorylase [candidate division KSB1 bacterium]|nr:purine-nucleoside phosphorylase [candidate division KSB1 bacterium]
MELESQLSESFTYIRTKTAATPGVAIILGSGLGHFVDELTEVTAISCRDIPHYPISTVAGHAGRMVFGQSNGISIVALQGRVHSYEGYPLHLVTYPVRLLAKLGVSSLIVTNAAGAVNPSFSPGNLMLITDHINFSFSNPLIGLDPGSEKNRFVDMANSYDPIFQELAHQTANQLGIPIRTGVLFMAKGPTYETAAEVRMIRTLGGDAVTMSTVPEVIAARQLGIRVMGLSCITNMATGVTGQKLDHHEVTVVAGQIATTFVKLVNAIIQRIAVA